MSGAPAAPRRVAFATLGCKLNQFETDSLATRFRETGYTIVDFEDAADVYVINSCTVTNRADRKSRNLLYRAERAAGTSEGTAASRPLVVLTGCYVDSHRESLESDGSTYFVPNEAKQSILELVEGHARGEIIHPEGSVFDFPVPDRIFHTRSVVKIQDGCDNFCTFCIIPHVRGRAVSRPWADVVAAVREAVAGGAREIVLTGVNMSRYRDEDVDFAELVSRCLELGVAGSVRNDDGRAGAPDYRLRISSLEPDQLSDRFLELFDHPRMAPHLHLCLQSASERVLLAMRRQYGYELYRSIAGALRGKDPNFNITTDIIVGFPGETDADFEASLAAVDELGFGHVHTFPYSVRNGTRAERMPGHLCASVKTERSALIRSAAKRAKRRYRERLVGKNEWLLVERVEKTDDGFILRGLGEHYVPVEVQIEREANGELARRAESGDLVNRLLRVALTSLAPGDDPPLLGEVI